jgi:outer membrane immunogenic protein
LFGLSSAVLAAKPHPKPVPPPLPPAVFSWTGYYVGANIGYSWGMAKTSYSSPAFSGFGIPSSLLDSQKVDGVLGGVQIGYNWQANNNWVYGLETDFQGSGERGRGSFDASYFFDFPAGFSSVDGVVTTKILWFGTVRGRVGYLINPTTLLYATGGLAYGGIKSGGTVTNTHTPATWSFGGTTTDVGWTVGGGIEGVVPNTSAWTWKVEYLYVDLGKASWSGATPDPTFPTYTWSAKVTDNIVRVGLNYKWPY